MAKKVSSLTFVLNVIAYRGETMFFDPVTGRAATSLYASSLPLGSQLVLKRKGREVTRAEIMVLGVGEYTQAFEGNAPLVRPDVKTEDRVVYDIRKAKVRYSRTIHARFKGIRVGDTLAITIAKQGPLDADRTNWNLQQWRENIAPSGRLGAFNARRLECTESRIYNLLGYGIADRFLERHEGKAPSELLRLAKEQFAKKTKNQRSRKR